MTAGASYADSKSFWRRGAGEAAGPGWTDMGAERLGVSRRRRWLALVAEVAMVVLGPWPISARLAEAGPAMYRYYTQCSKAFAVVVASVALATLIAAALRALCERCCRAQT